MRRILVLLTLALTTAALAAPADATATFPGSNGKIAIGIYPPDSTGTKRIDTRTLEDGDTGALGLEVGKLQYGEYTADGTRLLGYYGEFGGSAMPSGMYVADPVSSSMTRVLPSYFPAKFLPDGRILYKSGNSLRRIQQDGTGDEALALPALPQSVYGFFVAPDGGSIYFATAGWDSTSPGSDQIRRLDLTTGVSTTIASRPYKGAGDSASANVLDVSPDGSQLLLSIDTNGEISGGGGLAPSALHVMSVSGGAQRLLPTTAGTRPSGRFSPDGTMVIYIGSNKQDDAGEPTGDIPVHVINVDGSGDRRLVMYPQSAQNGFTTLAWQPGPPLMLTLEGGTLAGDLVELDVMAGNIGTSAFTNLRYDDSGHAPGIVFNTAPYSPEYRAGFTLISGPIPTLLAALEPAQQTQHQYLLGIDSPGNVQVRTKWYATGARTGEITLEKTAYVVARNRDLPRTEEAVMVAGGWAEVQDASQRDFDQLMMQSVLSINAKLPANLRKPTAVERELAQSAGMPEQALSWLPADTPAAVKAYVAFTAAKFAAKSKVVKTKLGSAYKVGIETPFDYWSDQFSDTSTAVPAGTAIFDEAAYWSIKGEQSGRGYAKDAYALATDPKRQHQFKQAVAQSVLDMDNKMKKIAKVAPGKARQIADQMAKDPVKAATMLGTAYGTIEGEAAFIAAEVAFTPNKGAIARGVKNVGGRLVGFADDAADTNRTLKGMRTVAKSDDNLADAARHGMPKADQTRWQGIVRQVEAHAKKHGYDIKLELSFRPRNVHSAAIGDAGSGKNMFMKGKTGTELDLVLGMDPSGLGKLVIYKPVRPANFAKLPPSMRQEIDIRMKDIESARAEWLNPKSNLGRARTGKGVTLKAELTNPKTGEKIGTSTVKMRIAGYEKNGTISVKYLEHVVDGKTIVKPGKPKWVISDYDGNAVLQVGGKDLPGGAVRGLVEAEVLRLQRENGTAMATSFHGFTYNGMDLPGKYYRNNFHFILEGMNDAQAKQAMQVYLKKYATSQADFDELLESYTYGDYVVRVTADAAFATQGL